MGNCCAVEKDTRTVNRQSSLANLDDSRHTMMKKAASSRGGMMQTEGSFYRPRSERILSGIPKADDPDSDIDDNVGVTDLPVFRNSGNMFIEDMKGAMEGKSSKAGKEKTADTAASKEKELISIEEESESKE